MSSQPSPSSTREAPSVPPWGPLRALATGWRPLIDPAGPASRVLTIVLAVIAGTTALLHVPALSVWTPGVDLEIPLRAAERWVSGGQPYLASSFSITWGPNLPFLYPPWVLPLLAPLTGLPQQPILYGWLLLSGGAAVWACRRLSIPWYGLPFVLAWPPFAEGLVTGNIQVVQFAAFAALFYLPGAAWSPRPRRLEAEDDAVNGLLAAGVGAMKYTQLVPLAFLVARPPRAVMVGVVALAAVVLAFLSFTGIGPYWAWLAQLERAANPAWPLVGSPLSSFIGRPLSLVAAAIAVLGVLFVSGPDAGAWVGIALLVAAPSVHGYTMLFLMPALLTIRRDLALVLALAIGTYIPPLWWVSIAIAAATLAASGRIPDLRQPIRSVAGARGRERAGEPPARGEEESGAAAA